MKPHFALCSSDTNIAMSVNAWSQNMNMLMQLKMHKTALIKQQLDISDFSAGHMQVENS